MTYVTLEFSIMLLINKKTLPWKWFINRTNTVAYFYYRLYFYNSIPESFLKWWSFFFCDRCFMQQLFNWQFLNSIFISPLINYSFWVKKNKTHLQSFSLAQYQFYISWCAQFCIWKGMCLLSDEQCVILFTEEVSDPFHCLVVLT